MAKCRMDVTAFVGNILNEEDADVLHEGRQVTQALMEPRSARRPGALPYERSVDWSAYRNGYHTRSWDARVGTIELKIPKLTSGSYFPRCSSRAGGPRRPCTRS